MKLNTSIGETADTLVLHEYFKSLVNRFFKILPMRENNEASLPAYIQSLQREIIGFSKLIPSLYEVPSFVSLLSILEYLNDTPECPVHIVRTEVFHAINICSKLKNKLMREGGVPHE